MSSAQQQPSSPPSSSGSTASTSIAGPNESAAKRPAQISPPCKTQLLQDLASVASIVQSVNPTPVSTVINPPPSSSSLSVVATAAATTSPPLLLPPQIPLPSETLQEQINHISHVLTQFIKSCNKKNPNPGALQSPPPPAAAAAAASKPPPALWFENLLRLIASAPRPTDDSVNRCQRIVCFAAVYRALQLMKDTLGSHNILEPGTSVCIDEFMTTISGYLSAQ